MIKKRKFKKDGIVKVTFELPEEAGGEVVHLVGEFTDWQGIPMKQRKDGSWRTTVELEPGRSYQFRYLVDGEDWENDWEADQYVQNPFGGENSVVETPELAGKKGGKKAPAKKGTSAKSGSKDARKKRGGKKS